MSEPNLIEFLYNFMSASAFWLTQVAVNVNYKSNTTYAPLDVQEIHFPLSTVIPDTLKYVKS